MIFLIFIFSWDYIPEKEDTQILKLLDTTSRVKLQGLHEPLAVTKLQSLLFPDWEQLYSYSGRKVSRARSQITVSASEVLFLHLEKEFLLLPEYVVTRTSLFTGDAISWELPSCRSQEYDTTHPSRTLKVLPLVYLQGHDA